MSEKKPFDTENENMQANKKSAKPKSKKRKKARVSVKLTAVLLILALLFGVVVGFAIVLEKGVAGEFSAVDQHIVSAGALRLQSQQGHGLGDDGKLPVQVIFCLGYKKGKVQIPQVMEYRAAAGEPAG